MQYQGPGFAKPSGALNFNLSNPKNHRCCAYQFNFFTYAYPDTLGCLSAAKCTKSDVYKGLMAECDHLCPPYVGQVRGNTESAPPIRIAAPYWSGTCVPFVRSSAAGLRPSLFLLPLLLLR